MMQENDVAIAYGRSFIPVKLPSGVEATVIRKATLPKIADQHAAVMDVFARPIGAPIR